MKLSVIMPVFNGEKFIVNNTKKVESLLNDYLSRGLIHDYEILVVDDGSTDRTLELLRRNFNGSSKIIIVENTFNQGKGFALKNGFFNSSGDVVILLDSDLDIPPEQMEDLIREFKNGYDIVITSKFEKGSRLRYPWFRKIISLGFYAISKLLFGLPFKDTQTGLKLFRREVLELCLSRMVVKRFAFDLELLLIAHRYNFSIRSIPVRINYRGSGFINPRVILMTLVDILAVFYRLRVLQFYDRPVFISRNPTHKFYFIGTSSDLEGINCENKPLEKLENSEFVILKRYNIKKTLDLGILSSLITSYKVEIINGASLLRIDNFKSFIKSSVLCSYFLQPIFNLRYRVISPRILPIPVSNFICVSGRVFKYLLDSKVDIRNEKELILCISKKYHSVLFASDWNHTESFSDTRLVPEFFKRIGILISTGNIGGLTTSGIFMAVLWAGALLSIISNSLWPGIPFLLFFSLYFSVKVVLSGIKYIPGFILFLGFSLILSVTSLILPLLLLVINRR